MSLGDHLRELRRRVVISLIAIVIGAAVGWWQYDWIFEKLVAPIKAVAAERGAQIATVNFTGMTDAFSILITVGLFVGVVIASPVWLFQIWAFIVPGLTTQEKRTAMLFIAGAVPLFLAGCALGYLTLPRAATALLSFTPVDATNILPADAYLNFVLKFILAFGLAFLLPVFLVGLNAAGVLPSRVMLRGLAAGRLPHLPLRGDDDAVAGPVVDDLPRAADGGPVLRRGRRRALIDRRRAKRDVAIAWRNLPDDQASPI